MAKLQPVFHLSDNPWCAEWHNHFSVSARCKREITWLDSVSDGYRKDDDEVYTSDAALLKQSQCTYWVSASTSAASFVSLSGTSLLCLLLPLLWFQQFLWSEQRILWLQRLRLQRSPSPCQPQFWARLSLEAEIRSVIIHDLPECSEHVYWKCHYLLSKMQFPYWFGCNFTRTFPRHYILTLELSSSMQVIIK